MAGGVVHFEIPADDEDRARQFYSAVFGWSFQVMPEMEYSLALTTPMDEQGRPVTAGSINGGLFRRGEFTAPVITVGVDDIEAVLAEITARGGAVVRGRMEVPGMGWNAYIKDSEGNVIGLWQDAGPEGGAAAADPGNDIGA